MSVREDIASNVASVIAGITSPAVRKVSRQPFPLEELSQQQYPAVLVQTIEETKEDQELVVNFVSTNSDIQKGDIISTSGAGNRFKPKIPIGKVRNVSNNLDTEFKIVEIEPFEDPKRMPELILIWDYKPKENINE